MYVGIVIVRTVRKTLKCVLPTTYLHIPQKISFLLMLATKLRYELSYTASESIMNLAGVLSQGKCSFTPPKYIMKATIAAYSSSLTEHHVCYNCGFYIGIMEDASCECRECGVQIHSKKNKQMGNFFLYLPLREQLKMLLESNDLVDELIDPHNRGKICPLNYEDIEDGRQYKKRVLADCISFNFFVDGLQV